MENQRITGVFLPLSKKKVIDSNPKVKKAGYKTSLIVQVLNEHPASFFLILMYNLFTRVY